MKIIDRLKRRFSEWRERHSVVAELEFLADAIARITKLSESLSNNVPASARDHLERADKNYRKAMAEFQEEELNECQRFINRGELHIHLAEHQIRCREAPALELDLGASRIESQLLELSRPIVKIKLTVEYANCIVPTKVQKGLIDAAAKFSEALELFKKRKLDQAESITEAGLLLLHWSALRIRNENSNVPLEVRLSKKLMSRSAWRIKEYADQLFEDINKFTDSGLELSPTAAVHVKDAEGCLRTSVKALLVGDSSGVEHAITAGFSELKFINKLFAASTGEISHRGKSDRKPAAPDRTEYGAKIEGLKRVLAMSESKDAVRISKHLDASALFYAQSNEKMVADDVPEASRLARAAYLDLDYARQIALSDSPAKYLDI